MRQYRITHYFKLPFFQLFSLVLIAAKVFGFSDMSWVMCLAPVTFEILVTFTLDMLKSNSSNNTRGG